MNLYIALASHAIAAAIAFGAAWQMQAATITQMELESAHEIIEAQLEARDATEQRVAAVTAAQNNAQARIRTVATERSRADAIGSGLRISTAEAVRASAEDATLCSDTATTLGELLTTVTQERRELAEKADRHVVDIRALKERESAQ